jgi:cytochrome c
MGKQLNNFYLPACDRPSSPCVLIQNQQLGRTIMNVASKYLVAAGLGLAGLATLTFSPAAHAQDAANGEAVFKKCRACHQVGPTAKNGVGPAQNGVVGRKAGTVEGFAYSDLNKAAGEAGLVWDEANIFEYLVDPNAFLKKFITDKGKTFKPDDVTKMTFKLADADDRKDVIAYLKTQK